MRTALVAALTVFLVAGCASRPDPGGVADPLSIAKDVRQDGAARERALKQVWAERLPGEKGRDAARESLKSIVWATANGTLARCKAIEILADDGGDAGSADTRAMLGLMLPVEPDIEVVRFVADCAVARGWTDLAPAFARSFGRRMASPKDVDRPERAALAGLFPGRPVEETLFAIFADVPGKGLDIRAAKRADDARRGAWEVLARLDPTGSVRGPMLARFEAPSGDALTGALKACATDLGCVPLTASQLKRVERLYDFADPVAKGWWQQTATAVARLRSEQRTGLALRHLEAVRWAAAERADLLAGSRESLLGELRMRLRSRSVVGRNVGDLTTTSFNRNRLEDWAEELAFLDVLTVLAIDEALRTPGVAADLLAQAERDRVNTVTEYGGVVLSRGPGVLGKGAFVVVLYVPRPTANVDDRRFVASEEMLEAGVRGLAHYHFHAQQVNNRDFAGPSPGDYEYAIEQGVPCVVLTTIRPGVMNADYYHAGGVTIDLGDVRE